MKRNRNFTKQLKVANWIKSTRTPRAQYDTSVVNTKIYKTLSTLDEVATMKAANILYAVRWGVATGRFNVFLHFVMKNLTVYQFCELAGILYDVPCTSSDVVDFINNEYGKKAEAYCRANDNKTIPFIELFGK